MKRAISLSFIIVGALALSGRAPATTIFLSATIDGAQANMGAGTGSPGTGSGQVALDGVSNLLSWNVTWSGLLGDIPQLPIPTKIPTRVTWVKRSAGAATALRRSTGKKRSTPALFRPALVPNCKDGLVKAATDRVSLTSPTLRTCR